MTRLMIIPAAGAGTRLGASVPKVLVPVAGRPMLDHLLDRYGSVANRFVVVVSPAAEALVAHHLEGRSEAVALVRQESPTGMLDAILQAEETVWQHQPDRVWITWCDQIAIHPRTVGAILQAETAAAEPAIVLPTCTGPAPYIHFERDTTGTITRVLHRREGDDMPPEGESDMGLFSLSRMAYLRDLRAFADAPLLGAHTGERNFLPFIAWLGASAHVVTIPATDPMEAVGINTPDELRRVDAYLTGLSTGVDEA
jgi:bifunctional UDP-N-acetylglucosamine pyrophosphorylase / glucosamine-1-phosphate N-acetyltransferase